MINMRNLKRLWLIVLCTIFAVGLANAQEIFYRDQATLLWDSVTADAQGSPWLPTDVVSYEAFIYDYNIGVGNMQDPTQLISVGSATLTEKLIVFPYRTKWVAGVRCKVVDAAGNVDYSTIAYSNVPVDTGNHPFLYVPYLRVPLPGNLRDSGM
jgi:hypothetical protein